MSYDVVQRRGRTAEHVAFRYVESVGPSHPSNLTANVIAENIGTGNGRQMRIVDADESRGLVSGRIVNHFPIVFRRRNDIVIISIHS